MNPHPPPSQLEVLKQETFWFLRLDLQGDLGASHKTEQEEEEDKQPEDGQLRNRKGCEIHFWYNRRLFPFFVEIYKTKFWSLLRRGEKP